MPIRRVPGPRSCLPARGRTGSLGWPDRSTPVSQRLDGSRLREGLYCVEAIVQVLASGLLEPDRATRTISITPFAADPAIHGEAHDAMEADFWRWTMALARPKGHGNQFRLEQRVH